MISGQRMMDLQQQMNGLWFSFKKLRDEKGNFGATDEDVVEIIDDLLESQSKIDKLIEKNV